MNHLIIGAGSVGQALGFYLSRGGACVGVLVRPRQAEQARVGYRLQRLRRLRAPLHQHFGPDEVFDDVTQIRPGGWDVVWLCVPSTALRGDWIEQLRAWTGSAMVASITQDARDRVVLEDHWPAEQIVLVTPSIFAFSPPSQDGSAAPQTTSYWIPPGSAWAASGTHDRARAIADALNAGGLKTNLAKTSGGGEMIDALTMPYIAQIESDGWSLHTARRNFRAASAAATEAVTVVAAAHGAKAPAPPARSVLGMRVIMRAFMMLAPFDVERYLRIHFTKTGQQTRLMLDDLITEGAARDLPTTHLRALRASLPALPA
jgi:hypothetical protein